MFTRIGERVPSILICLMGFLLWLHEIEGHVDCSLGATSCKSCMVAYPFCYWCDSSSGGSCLQYLSSDESEAYCPNHWSYKVCPTDESVEYESESQRVEKLFKLILQLEQSKKHNSLESTSKMAPLSAKPTSMPDPMKEVLHKLLLLKLLQRVRANLEENKPAITESAAKGYKSESMKSNRLSGVSEFSSLEYLEKLLNISEVRKNKLPASSGPVGTIKAISQSSPETSWALRSLATTMSPAKESDRGEEVDLEYIDEEAGGADLKIFSKILLSTVTTVTEPTTYISHIGHPSDAQNVISRTFCELYDSRGACNTDNNCTWCYTKDLCMTRSLEDYAACVGNSKRMSNLDYDLDHCLAFKSCSGCVADEKCYWCATSKSCHSYPFFGYVPHACASGNWFYKQCDVQLAVIVVILPLFIVLLAMLTFYFCLKYCYYRKKLLRVPLFERPGVFDYRKNKKVYFVNANDDDSDAELKAERLRKKYRLPVERESLIDPNT